MDTTADSIRFVGEADLLELARVARSTWKNWLRAGVVGDAPDGLYDEPAVVELVIVAVLVGALEMRQVGSAWRRARDDVLRQALSLAQILQ